MEAKTRAQYVAAWQSHVRTLSTLALQASTVDTMDLISAEYNAIRDTLERWIKASADRQFPRVWTVTEHQDGERAALLADALNHCMAEDGDVCDTMAALQVRGGPENDGFTGYDYKAQCWMTARYS